MATRVQINSGKHQDVYKAMLGLAAPLQNSTLEPALVELVKVRASQINGCGNCLDMHTKDARHMGETEQRLYLVSVWREAPLYTDRERAALEWTEALTKLDGHAVSDEVYERVRSKFSEDELMRLTLAVVAINGWNRICIGFNVEPGHYKPGMYKQSA